MHAALHDNQRERQLAEYRASGAQWAAAGHPHHAAHLFSAVLDVEPQDTRTRMMLADCLTRCNQAQAAAEQYLQVAFDLTAKRRLREALAICYRVIDLDASRFVYLAVADMLRKMGRHARPVCARAAEAHMATGRVSDALNMLRLGAELDARNPAVHRQLAQLFLHQHMVSEALLHLDAAGRLLLAAGNNAGYIEVAETLLRYNPQHLETLRELPRVYLRVGEPQQAVVKLSALMRVNPGDTVGFEILAQAFATIGRIETSVSILERLVNELTASQRRPLALAIIERALKWRLDDAQFIGSVRALAARKIPPPLRRPPSRSQAAAVNNPPQRDDATVVLKISDLMAAAGQSRSAAPDSSDRVEFADADGPVVLRVEDFSIVGPAPRKGSAPPPLPRKRASAPPPPPPSRSASRPASMAVETTQVVDLSDIEIDEQTHAEAVAADVTALIVDEPSIEITTTEQPALPRRLPPPPGYSGRRPRPARMHR